MTGKVGTRIMAVTQLRYPMTMTAHTIMLKAPPGTPIGAHEHHADRENPKHHDDHDQDSEAHEAALGDLAHEAPHGSGETVGIVAGRS